MPNWPIDQSDNEKGDLKKESKNHKIGGRKSPKFSQRHRKTLTFGSVSLLLSLCFLPFPAPPPPWTECQWLSMGINGNKLTVRKTFLPGEYNWMGASWMVGHHARSLGQFFLSLWFLVHCKMRTRITGSSSMYSCPYVIFSSGDLIFSLFSCPLIGSKNRGNKLSAK